MISVIIPVFNTGSFLYESIDSVFKNIGLDIEIIVVDDGSTDFSTICALNSLSDSGILILRKPNGGPASARNLGAKNSNREFLFFLDSDNLIRPDYLKKALKVMQNDSRVGIVYSKPNFFGSTLSLNERFKSKPFNFDSLLAGNYIDMCSLVKREAFWKVGGFDEHKDLIGWEDADLWIRLAQANWKFEFLDEVLFDYRVREDSLMGMSDCVRKERMLRYLGAKHGFIIHQKYRQYYRIMEKIQESPFSYFLRILLYKYILRKPFIN